MLVDTSCWIAFFVETDKAHQTADRFIQKEIKNSRVIEMLDTVLEEILALVRKRFSPTAATKVAEAILQSDNITVIQLPEQLIQTTMELFVTNKGKYSYVDCSQVVYLDSIQKPIIAAFDKDFAELGLRTCFKTFGPSN